MIIERDIKLNFDDVLIKPKRSNLVSRSEVDLHKTYKMKHSKKEMIGIPIVASNMDTTGTFEMAKELSKHHLYTMIHKFYTTDEWIEFMFENPECREYTFISSGISESDLEKVDEVIQSTGIELVCLDVANGYSERFVRVVSDFRKKYPHITLIAGDVCTAEMTEELLLAGADIIKCGIGPGRACLTRMKTGVGYPQLSCIIECSDAAHGLDGHIMSDGGCKLPADIAKAFGGGADFVILGGMFAAHDESGGDLIVVDGVKYKEFYGMSSDKAMKKHYGGAASYRASEGDELKIKHRGPVTNTLKEILGGLRSTCTYVGARKLKELYKRCTFVRTNKIH
mgnify:CR=1 FL=1|jgi:GMP reductase